jgi:hypothetical protein
MHDEDQIDAVDAEHSENLAQEGAPESTPEQTEE